MTVALTNEQEIKTKLAEVNPTLVPNKLNRFFKDYTQFERNLDYFGLWQKPSFKQKIKQAQKKHQKLLLLLSGVAGGGKDDLRAKINQCHPQALHKIVTATSRKARSSEVDGQDYYFYETPEKFQQDVENDQFLEWVQQGTRFYGSPKKGFTGALAQERPLICTHVEMSAWPKVVEFVENEAQAPIFILKIFVLPNVTYQQYAHHWLPKKRSDHQARLSRTLWELAEAPQRADLLISNFHVNQPRAPFLNWQTQSLLRMIKPVLTSPLE